MKKKLVVFTDLDGTLLDHYSYRWDRANEALEGLHVCGCPVILNSSKTKSEIEALRTAMGNEHPFIVENGSAVIIPENYFPSISDTIKRFGPSRSDIISFLNTLRHDFHYQFTGFNDLSDSQLAELTGLNVESAHKAKQREASEPLVWNDTDERFKTFVSSLEGAGYSVIAGGRFLHVMGVVSKADSIQWLMGAYADKFPDEELLSVGLGDSDNDVPMLETVDVPVLIAGEHGKTIQVKRNNLIETQEKGPAGWNSAMLTLLNEAI